MKKIYFIITAMCLFGFIISINAQTRNPNQQNDEKKEKLLQLADEFHQKFKAEKAEAVRVAQEKGWAIREELQDGSLIEIMRLNDKGMPEYNITNNRDAARTSETDHLWSAPFNLDGSGMLIGEWDGGGVRTTHQEFGGRVTQVDGPISTSYHSTHVAGTLIASGVQYDAHGMANAANLDAYDWDFDESEMVTAVANDDLIISNHSYGRTRGWYNYYGTWYWMGDTTVNANQDYEFGFYGGLAHKWDVIANNAPQYLICKSAGNDRDDDHSGLHKVWDPSIENWVWSSAPREQDGGADGYDCIGNRGVAKNVLTVGAVWDIPSGYSSPADVILEDYSGWGPTDDGRIKPDIVANGRDLYSTDDDSDTDYTTIGGTSMSTPTATGTLTLFQDYYEDFRSGFMQASTLKGLTIHTAHEAGSSNGPDYEYGWGLLNATGAADLIAEDAAEDGALIVEGIIMNGQYIDYTYYCDGTSDIRVTLTWNDPAHDSLTPSLNPTTYTLVHDLDLYIMDPSSTWHYPWSLNPSSPSAAATNTGYNYRDNVERTDIYSPAAGYYTIRVDEYSSIPAEGQSYSLIIQGLETEPTLETYCIGNPARSTSDYEYIKNVTIGGINNASDLSPGGYANYTGLVEEVTKGGSESISVTIGNYFSTTDVTYAWVDWNQDGDFEDAGEEYNLGNTEIVTGVISVPSDALSGYTTMRVRMKYGTPTACGLQSFSETEDYTLKVLGTPGLWTGLGSGNSWHIVGNWDDGNLPDASTNVVIPDGTPHDPYIFYDDAYCNNITIETGAYLAITDDTSPASDVLKLYVSGNMTVYGYIYMNGGAQSFDGEIQVEDDILWYNGSRLYTNANDPIIRAYGSWRMYSGAEVHMDHGTIMFYGTTNEFIENDEPTCYLNNVGSYKSGGAYIGFSSFCDADTYINGFMYVHPGAAFNHYSSHNLFLEGDINNHGTFVHNFGTLVMTGATQYIRLTAGSHLNNFTINSSGTVYFIDNGSDILTVNGNVQIDGGVLNCGSFNIEVGSSWTNNVGTGGFNEGTGTVTFNGTGDVAINSNETFYNLTLDKDNVPDELHLYGDIDVLGNLTLDYGYLYSNDNVLSVHGNATLNSGSAVFMDPNSTLAFGSGSQFTAYSNAAIWFAGTAGNECLVTRISTGTYSFSIFGSIAPRHTTFEWMNGDGINVKGTGYVVPSYGFDNCSFRNGAPSPSALLVLNGDNVFTSDNAYFENTSGLTQYNVWKYYDTGDVLFNNATGAFAGETYDYDPWDRVDWYNVGFTISGNITYPNSGTPLNNCTVNLMDGAILVDQTTTNASGYYEFTSVVDGSYTLVTTCSLPYTYITTLADYNVVVSHLLGTPLTGLFYLAGEVSGDGSISLADYNLMVSNLLGSIYGYPAVPDWRFEDHGVTVSGGDVTEDFEGIMSGDATGSGM